MSYPTVPASGGVSNVTASSPLASSGGATPNLTWLPTASGASRVNLLGPYTSDQTISATAWDGFDVVRVIADSFTAGADLTFTLPAATGIDDGCSLEIVNLSNPSGYAVKVAGVTVAGAASPVTLYTCAYGCATLTTDGTDWLAGDLNTRLTAAEGKVNKVVSRTITHADLTTVGTTQAITIGAVPAGARLLNVWWNTTTLFSGGGVVTLSLDVGWAGTATALVDAAGGGGIDLIAGTNSTQGQYGVGAGTNTDMRGVAGKTVLATFTCDGGHTLDQLTAGSIYIEIGYFIPA